MRIESVRTSFVMWRARRYRVFTSHARPPRTFAHTPPYVFARVLSVWCVPRVCLVCASCVPHLSAIPHLCSDRMGKLPAFFRHEQLSLKCVDCPNKMADLLRRYFSQLSIFLRIYPHNFVSRLCRSRKLDSANERQSSLGRR